MITINNELPENTDSHFGQGLTFIENDRLYFMTEPILSSHVGHNTVCLGPICSKSVVTSMDEPGRISRAAGMVIPVDITITITERKTK